MKAIRVLGALPIVAFLAGPSQPVLTQTQVNYADLFTMAGKVIAKGTNTNPIGPYGIKTYRIEELALAPRTRVIVDGAAVEASAAWRITVMGTSFQPRALPPIVSIDSTDLRPAQESTDLAEIAAIAFDKSLIHDGAVIRVAYGPDRTELPERVKLASVR